MTFETELKKLKKANLIDIIMYQNEQLKSCQEICKDFAQNNFAQQPLHKVACAMKEAQLGNITTKLSWLLHEVEYKKVFGNE